MSKAIVLTTAVSPGDLDPGKSYTHARISHIENGVKKPFLRMYAQLGYVDSGVFAWAPENLSPPTPFTVEGTDLATLLDGALVVSGDVDERVYDVNMASLHQWLIDESHYAGTVGDVSDS